MICKQCGSEVKEGNLFCTKCGARIDASASAQNSQTFNGTQSNGFNSQNGAQFSQPQSGYSKTSGEAHHGKVGFGKAVSLFFKNMFNFKGRASKSEYWWAFLFNIIASSIVGIIPVVGLIASLVLGIAGISLTVRRLHDVGKSGGYWFVSLIPIAGTILILIQTLKDSEGDNKWGAGPATASSQKFETPVVNNNYQAQNTADFNGNVANNGGQAKTTVTENDIYAIAQNYEPINMNTPEAKIMMSAALGKIIPTYTGNEDLSSAMLLCDPQSIKSNIAAADTDTLIIAFKALGFHISNGGNAGVIGIIQQNVLETLKTRF